MKQIGGRITSQVYYFAFLQNKLAALYITDVSFDL